MPDDLRLRSRVSGGLRGLNFVGMQESASPQPAPMGVMEQTADLLVKIHHDLIKIDNALERIILRLSIPWWKRLFKG